MTAPRALISQFLNSPIRSHLCQSCLQSFSLCPRIESGAGLCGERVGFWQAKFKHKPKVISPGLFFVYAPGMAHSKTKSSSPQSRRVFNYGLLVFSNSKPVSVKREAFATAGAQTDYCYDNTVYGWNVSTIAEGNYFEAASDTFQNNILVDTKGNPYFAANPSVYSNNLFYSTYSTPPSLPSFYSTSNGDKNANPLFNNAGSYGFSLQSGSPALAAGYNLTATYPLDFYGNTRPVPHSIGAAELTGGGGGGTSLTAPGRPYIEQ